MTARHMTADEFGRELQQTELPTLVDFYADWCGPCRAMAPVIDKLADEFDGKANVVKDNVDEAPDLAVR